MPLAGPYSIAVALVEPQTEGFVASGQCCGCRPSRCFQVFRWGGRKIRDEETREIAQPLMCLLCKREDEGVGSAGKRKPVQQGAYNSSTGK